MDTLERSKKRAEMNTIEDVADRRRKIGGRLKELREERFLSQQELADRAGVSKDQFGRIERGEHAPQGRTLRKLAAALEVEPSELVK